MGKTDTVTKNYMRRPDVFADVFNQFLYHGRQMILPDRLVELDTTEIAVPYGTGQALVPEQKYRDVAKLLTAMTDGKAAYCILAVENESKINYAMLVKDGLYDFMQLAKQVTETANAHKKDKNSTVRPSTDEFLSGFWKSDRLLPVVTLVVYFGAEEWDGPLSLKEMYADVGKEILKYAADYQINLIAPKRLSERKLNEFHTNFREIMKFIKYSTDSQQLKEKISSDKRFQNVERQAVDVINSVTGSKVKYSKRKEAVNVCIAIQEIREEGRMEGRMEGRQQGKIEGFILAYKEMGRSQEEAKTYITMKCEKNEEEADALIKKYWK